MSRKTYFGIGWPKDPTDPDPAAPAKSDPEDRSAPTVVDDERVAEGLRQLRSWYQSDAPPSTTPADEPTRSTPPAPHSTRLGARPTAVGHATGPPPAAVQRPVAPDPMRATMYGHDVHQFDFEAARQAAAAAEAASPAESTALVVSNPAPRAQEAFPQQPQAVPDPASRSPSDSFPLARYGQGEAQRLHRPGGGHRSSSYPVPAARRMPIASSVVFGIGIAALTAAIVIWVNSNGSESTTREPARAPAPAAQAQAPAVAPPGALATPPPAAAANRPPAPTPGLNPAATAGATERPAANAAPAPKLPAPPAPRVAAAAPVAGESKSAHPSAMVLKTPRRPKEPKPEVSNLPTEVDEASTTALAPPSEKDTPEAREVKEVKETKETKEASAPREIKEPAEVKEAKETKAAKDTRTPKDAKTSKDARVRPSEADLPLPPSLQE